jgi:hypothetical protein
MGERYRDVIIRSTSDGRPKRPPQRSDRGECAGGKGGVYVRPQRLTRAFRRSSEAELSAAGIRLKEQNDADKLWIRDLFLKHKAPHEKYVVHGHTPLAQCVPDVQANRINIDTALVFGGRLTAAVFDELQAEAVDLLQVKAMSLEPQI